MLRGYEAYCEVLAHENFGVGLKELDPDTWRTLDQRFAFVAQAFLPPPPPPTATTDTEVTPAGTVKQ